jgi:hypothetical protein
VDGNQIRLVVHSMDGTQRAQVTLSDTLPVRELLATCQKNWSLSPDETYALRHLGSNQQLKDGSTLREAGLTDGSEIMVFPVFGGG